MNNKFHLNANSGKEKEKRILPCLAIFGH